MEQQDGERNSLALKKKLDEQQQAIIRREEMPRMLEAISRNDFETLKNVAEQLIRAQEKDTLDMALASAILCNNLTLVRYLVEVGFLNQKANVARTMMLLVESRGEQWYIGYQEGKPYCAVQKDIVHYLAQHFIIPFNIPK